MKCLRSNAGRGGEGKEKEKILGSVHKQYTHIHTYIHTTNMQSKKRAYIEEYHILKNVIYSQYDYSPIQNFHHNALTQNNG